MDNIKDISIRQLRKICQATAPDPQKESWTGRFCRIFSIYFTKLFLYTKITPNQITALSVIVFFGGVALFIFNNYFLNLLAVFLIMLSIILDGCDGEVARFRKIKGSVGGIYTEPVSHDIQYGLSFFLIGLFLYINGYSGYYLFLGAGASIFKLLYRLLKLRFTILKQTVKENLENKREHNSGAQKQPSRLPFFKNLLSFVDRNFLSSTGFLLTTFIFVLLNKIEFIILFYGVGYFLFWLALFLKQIYIIYYEGSRSHQTK